MIREEVSRRFSYGSLPRNKILNTPLQVLIILLLAISIVMSGCAGKAVKSAGQEETDHETESNAEEQTKTYLSMATNGDWSVSFKGQVMEKELEKLERRTGETMKIKLYDRSRLGDDLHLISGVQTGSIDIVQSSPSMQINAVPEAAMFDIPGFFGSLDEWNALFESDYRHVMEEYYEKADLVLLDIFAYGYRNLSSREPVVTTADLQGVRIRTQENKYHEAYWDSLGATAIPYRFAELYFCLHEGMADAQENLLDVMLTDHLYEVQNCITFTRHMPMVSAIAVNQEKYENLTSEQKEELKQFTEGLKEALIRQMPEEEIRQAETLDNDYEIAMLEPSGELQGSMEAGTAVVLELLRSELGNEKVDTFLQAAEKIRK
ncbi:TRAP transporter substrate-binding protein [Clostridium transplantifaecale]|uniref:TRAP transporter substrate-binding protein n=1 Tax=Clostridium transplantifaecale TaxID=2479838 RepID=UPI000F642271|nr:TRAP transporter substrate-binding protein [Clostridium transplantifaecale]